MLTRSVVIPFLSCLLVSVGAAASLTPEWRIVHGTDPLERTAAQDVANELNVRWGIRLPVAANVKSTARSIVIGTIESNPVIAAEHRVRPFNLPGESPERYHLALRGETLFAVGATAKGAMNAAFRFLDKGTLDPTGIDEAKSPAFRYRIGDHLRTNYAPPDWSEEDQARYYARHYVNLLWGEKLGPPLPYEVRKKYGLGVVLEASLPPTPEGEHWGDAGSQSPWWDDPANASAIYWWGRFSWYGKVKVVDPFDPAGRQAYLNHFNKRLEKNPDTKVLYCIFGDYSWAPNPDSTRISDGRKYTHGQEETILEIVSLMKEAIGDRDVIPAVWMWLLFPKQGKEAFMEELAARGVGVMYNEASDNDCWTYLRDNFDPVVLKQAPEGGSKFGPNFIPLVSLGGTCESVRPAVGLPLPAIGAGKLVKLQQAGIRQFIIWWGSCEGWSYHANNEVLSELFWNPVAFDPRNPAPFHPTDGEPLLFRIAKRDFGEALAPGVLKFWNDFEHALVDKDRSGTKTGLQMYSWYQRTGAYLVFLDGQAIPLIPEMLARKDNLDKPQAESTVTLFPWAIKPEAIANFADVTRNLARVLTQLDTLIARAEQPAVQERLESMRENALIFQRTLMTQYNHMRALRLMEDLPGITTDSAYLKARLLPILAEEARNTQMILDQIKEYPPNWYYGGGKNRNDPERLEKEMAKLRKKLEAMKSYARSLPGIAARGSTSSGNTAVKIDLERIAPVDTVLVVGPSEDASEFEIAVSNDGISWEPVGKIRTLTWGAAAGELNSVPTRFVRVTSNRPGSFEAGVALAPLLKDLRVAGAQLRPAFSPAVSKYQVIAPGPTNTLLLEWTHGSAERILVNETLIQENRAALAFSESSPVRVVATGRETTVQYTLNPLINLAFGRPVTSDSVGDGMKPALAVDGQGAFDDSRWLSQGSSSEHWLAVDLGESRAISGARVCSGYRGASALPIQDFRLQSSEDGKEWHDIPGTVIESNRETALNLKFRPAPARHIRLLITKTPDNIARLYELELYGN